MNEEIRRYKIIRMDTELDNALAFIARKHGVSKVTASRMLGKMVQTGNYNLTERTDRKKRYRLRLWNIGI